MAQGRRQGQASLILSQLKRRIGEIESEDETRINSLSEEQLQGLGDVVLLGLLIATEKFWSLRKNKVLKPL